MTDTRSSAGEAADRVTQLEASSDTATGGSELERARGLLHQWVASVTAVVATPGVGRVVLIHANGRESRITSPDLPSLLAPPVRFRD